MPDYTPKLNLPKPLGNENFNRAGYNALIDAIDSKAGASDGLATLDASGKVPASQLNVSAPPDASTTVKGVVQLSNSATSTSEVLAATPRAVKTVDDKIGILSGLNTTAKDNLVNAVNELFTFANDGKTKWSSVIGSPLASSDTFTQMQTKTQTIKNTLATNLTAKGQSSVGTETLTALSDKVANIQTGLILTPSALNTIASATTSRQVYASVYTKVKEAKINYNGTVRVSFTMYSYAPNGTAEARVYVNGVAVGSVRSNSGNTFNTFTQDFAIKTGDLVQVYARTNNTSNSVSISDFFIRVNQPNLAEVLID